MSTRIHQKFPWVDHAPAGNLNLIYELSPKGKLPKICPLRRTRSHHCVALNLALLAGRKLFHLPPLLKMYHWGEHGQNVVANSTLSFLPWGAFNKYMEIILPYLLLTYLNLDSFYYEGRQTTHSFFLFNRSYSFLSFGGLKSIILSFIYSVCCYD